VAVLALIWREGAGFGLNRERGEGRPESSEIASLLDCGDI